VIKEEKNEVNTHNQCQTMKRKRKTKHAEMKITIMIKPILLTFQNILVASHVSFVFLQLKILFKVEQ
jgi:hypothetical protein